MLHDRLHGSYANPAHASVFSNPYTGKDVVFPPCFVLPETANQDFARGSKIHSEFVNPYVPDTVCFENLILDELVLFPGMSAKLVEELAHNVPNIVGMKDTSGDITQTSEFIRRTRDVGFKVFGGKDTLLYASLCHGAVGGVCTAANFMPELITDVYNKFAAGDLAGSLEAQFKLNPVRLSMDAASFPVAAKDMAAEDKWVLSKLNRLVKEVTENLDSFEIGVASAKVYDFIWDTYCDWYIELTKTRLNGTDEDAKLTAQNVLCYVLVTLLKLLHPFMPFITEEIYQALPKCDGAEDILMTAQWPEYTETLSFPAEESAMEAVMDLIRAIRARRAEMNVPPSKKAELMIVTDQAEPYQQGLHFIQRLAYASNVTFPETAPADVTGLVSVVTHDATAYLPLSELVDLAAERERIAKELEKAKNGLRITEGKLANEKFVAHAPENVVNAEREKVAKYQELIAKLEESAKAMA